MFRIEGSGDLTSVDRIIFEMTELAEEARWDAAWEAAEWRLSDPLYSALEGQGAFSLSDVSGSTQTFAGWPVVRCADQDGFFAHLVNTERR